MNFAEFVSQIRWRPQIGDPSFMGWFTVAAYAAAAVLCFIAAHRCLVAVDAGETRRRRRMWLGVGVLMAFLCINKQLDLQSLFTDVGRVLANQEGWYSQRRAVQRWFVIAMAAAGAMTFVILAWKIRHILRESIVLLLGLCSLITFIVIRAASFHHVDVLLGSELLGIRVNWILELGGIALIALSAARSARPPRDGVKPTFFRKK
jgi:hypothetical protein